MTTQEQCWKYAWWKTSQDFVLSFSDNQCHVMVLKLHANSGKSWLQAGTMGYQIFKCFFLIYIRIICAVGLSYLLKLNNFINHAKTIIQFWRSFEMLCYMLEELILNGFTILFKQSIFRNYFYIIGFVTVLLKVYKVQLLVREKILWLNFNTLLKIWGLIWQFFSFTVAFSYGSGKTVLPSVCGGSN